MYQIWLFWLQRLNPTQIQGHSIEERILVGL